MDIKVIELLNGGDWACVYGESEALARTCNELADLVDQDLSATAREIAEWADRDMAIAVRRWGELATRVRYPRGRRRLRLASGSGVHRTPFKLTGTSS